MALLKIWEGSRGIMRLLVIHFVFWLGCFSTFAFAQFDISEGVTGSVTFPALGITCVSNLAVFVTTLIRGRLDLEIGARDVIEILLSPKLQNIERIKHGCGLTTCNEGGGDLPTAYAEPVPQTASREESDVHAASTRGTETASTEGNVNTSASTERGGLQTGSTAEIVIHIDSPEGQAAVAKKAKAAAAKAEEAAAAVAGGGGGAAAAAAAKAAAAAAKAAAAAVKAAAAAAAKGAAKAAEAAAEAAEEEEAAVAGAGAGAAKKAAKAAKAAAKAAEQKVAAAAAAEAAAEAAEAAEEEAAAAILFARKKGLKSAAVIMLSNDTANWSMKQFMKSNAYVVQSIVLPFLPLKRALNDTEVSEELTSRVTIQSCECRRRCHCIVFWTMEEITHMLATRMPATLKLLSNSLCLLPCSTCLRKGCHECESEADEGQPMRQRVVSDILDNIRAGDIPAGKPIAICIPMNDAPGDDWTKLLLKSLRSKDAEGRGVTNMAAEALEGYLAGGRGSEEGTVAYDIFSFVVPRLTEVLINLVLTFWFRVDSFSSALVARRTVRDYLVDTKSSGFAANAFLTKAQVKSNGDNSRVCQVLTFRGHDWLCFITFICVGCVNVICALGWALLISFEGGSDTSQRPSLPIVVVIIAAIGSPWLVFMRPRWFSFMLLELLAAEPDNTEPDNTVQSSVRSLFDTVRHMTVCQFVFVFVFGIVFGIVMVMVFIVSFVVGVVISPVLWVGAMVAIVLKKRPNGPYASGLIATGLLFEMACLVSWSALAGALGIKGFGRWLYAALQILIWVKWATGSYFLNQENSSEFFGRMPDRLSLIFYSSPFWLNAVLAGVRCKWEAWPWKHNHLF